MFEDMERLLRKRLGPDYDPHKIEAVLEIVGSLRQDKTGLDAAVRTGRLSGRRFADRSNTLLHDYLEKIAAVLGPTDYERVFHKRPDQRTNVINPRTATEAYRR